MNKTYKGEDFEVLWQPAVCIHSTICWKNMQEVFNPFRRPWIILENGEREAIKNQVKACPSGALQWIEKSENQEKAKETENELVHVAPSPNGPLLVKGEIMIIHQDGKREVREKQTAFCRCGASENKPFCDGSHKKIGFEA
jgi:uncharacterized Fe-S cluster protein YjdI